MSGTTPDEATAAVLAAVNNLRATILDEGPVPEHHRRVMARHRAEWPSLWSAIDALESARLRRVAALRADRQGGRA